MFAVSIIFILLIKKETPREVKPLIQFTQLRNYGAKKMKPKSASLQTRVLVMTAVLLTP